MTQETSVEVKEATNERADGRYSDTVRWDERGKKEGQERTGTGLGVFKVRNRGWGGGKRKVRKKERQQPAQTR